MAAVPLTTVAIGKPLVMTADEKGLKLPRSISNAYDVYWVQMAINPRADLRGKIDTLTLFVSLKTPEAETFELIPLRYGEEQSVKTTTAVPKAELKASELSVSIGQVYSQEVSYKALKPTIVGTGIQEAEFGWSLSNDMLDMSAKKLIAIVGVPKKTSKLDLEMIVTAHTNPQMYGIIQGNVASTVPVKQSVNLSQLR